MTNLLSHLAITIAHLIIAENSLHLGNSETYPPSTMIPAHLGFTLIVIKQQQRNKHYK